jgi:hypothetical protein
VTLLTSSPRRGKRSGIESLLDDLRASSVFQRACPSILTSRDRTKLPERRLGELPVGVVRIEREDCAVGEGVKSCPRAGCGRSSGSLLPGSCFITSKTSPGESLESLLVCSSIGSLRKCILNALVFKPFLKCCELIEMIGKLFQSAAAHVAMVRPVEIARVLSIPARLPVYTDLKGSHQETAHRDGAH